MAEPRAISRERFRSFTDRLPLPSAMFCGIDWEALSNWSLACRFGPDSVFASLKAQAVNSIEIL